VVQRLAEAAGGGSGTPGAPGPGHDQRYPAQSQPSTDDRRLGAQTVLSTEGETTDWGSAAHRRRWGYSPVVE